MQRDPDPGLLYLAALAYQSASWRIGQSARRATIDMWRRLRPVDDAGLSRWWWQWDRILAYGVPMRRVVPVPEPDLLAEVERGLARAREFGLGDELDRQIEEALRRIGSGQATREDLSRADRLPWMHSPVLDVRTGLSNGLDPDRALSDVEPRLGVLVDTTLRAAEGDLIGSVDWPRFKNGNAMLYKRVPQGGSCGWCRVVATRLYDLESYRRGSSWHAHCRCTMVLLTEAEARLYLDTQRRNGNYYEAAAAIGLWDGPVDDVNYNDVIGQRATVGGGTGE